MTINPVYNLAGLQQQKPNNTNQKPKQLLERFSSSKFPDNNYLYNRHYPSLMKIAFKGEVKKKTSNEIRLEKFILQLKTREELLKSLENEIERIELNGKASDRVATINNNFLKEETGIADTFNLKRADGSNVKVNLSRYRYVQNQSEKQLYTFKEADNGNIVGYCRMDDRSSLNEHEMLCFYADDIINLTEGKERIKGIGSIGLQLFVENSYLKHGNGNVEFLAQRIVKDKEGRSESPYILYREKGFVCWDGDENAGLSEIKRACDQEGVDYVYMDEVVKKNDRLWLPRDVSMKLSIQGRKDWLQKIIDRPILNETKEKIDIFEKARAQLVKNTHG